MFNLSQIPNIFFGVSAPLEVLAGLAAILIAVFSFKVHHYTSEKRFHWFGVAFALIALSFAASALVHLMIYFDLRERLSELFSLIGLGTFTLYVALLLAAYVLPASLHKPLVLVVGVVGVLFGLYSLFVGETFFGANLENPADTVLHLVVGIWALWAALRKQVLMTPAVVASSM